MGEPSMIAVKTLFAHSRNICFFTRCEERLTDPSWAQVNAEIAHIKGDRPKSARYDVEQSEEDRQGYENLMLLCPKHHKIIDRLEPSKYDVEILVEMRGIHLGHSQAKEWCSDQQAEDFALLAIQDIRDGQDLGLRIISAKYGEAETFVNVASLITNAVTNNTLRLSVTNDNMGGDPLEGIAKRLDIEYELDGIPGSVSFTEGEEAILP